MQGRIAGDQTRQPMNPGRNIRLVLAFDGTAYHGWQVQPDKPTVQGSLISAIEKIHGATVKVTGSGRTDAGTHARGLVVNFMTGARMPAETWVPALNRLLPHDIRVLSARQVPRDFHARLSAKSKIYRYQIYCGPVLPPHLAKEHFHYPYPLNRSLMEDAARLFVGEHDFASFAARTGLKAGRSSPEDSKISEYRVEGGTVRTVYRSTLKWRGKRLYFTVEGNGFLHHMVRNMIGTLLEVGRGRVDMDRFSNLFEKRDRRLAGFTAPANGLILMRVRY